VNVDRALVTAAGSALCRSDRDRQLLWMAPHALNRTDPRTVLNELTTTGIDRVDPKFERFHRPDTLVSHHVVQDEYGADVPVTVWTRPEGVFRARLIAWDVPGGPPEFRMKDQGGEQYSLAQRNVHWKDPIPKSDRPAAQVRNVALSGVAALGATIGVAWVGGKAVDAGVARYQRWKREHDKDHAKQG
jgi:hypothetical protein